MHKISIAIPTYNRKDYLKECIESILTQSFSDFKIYVFDNCSDYNIEKFINDFSDTRIELIKSPQNLGNIGNFERIYNYDFPSEYLVIFHDDDTMHPKFLEINYNLLQKNYKAVFSASSMEFISDDRKINIFKELNKELNIINIKDKRDFVRLLLNNFNLCFDSVVYRTSYIGKHFSIFSEKYGKWCDRPYLVELSNKGPVLIIDEKLVNYRIHLSQDSQALSGDKQNELLSLFSLYKETLLNGTENNEDTNLYYSYSTNFLLLSGFSFAKNLSDYLKFIEQAKKIGLFKLSHLNLRGIWYILVNIKKLY